MKFSQRLSIFLGLSFFVSHGFAQSSLEGFSTGRYEVRQSSNAKAKGRKPSSDESIEVKTVSAEEMNKAVEDVKPAELPKRTKKSAEPVEAPAVEVATPAPSPTPAIQTKEAVSAVASPGAPTALEEKKEVAEPGLSTQAQSLFNDGANKVYEFYKEQIHEDDIRNNRLEIEVAPVVMYNDSSSNYSFRDYQSFFNAMKVRANVWLTPLIGVSGQILFSFAADVDSIMDSSRVSAKYEAMDLGLNFRRFFGMSRKSNSLEFSILMSENKMTVPSDNTSRARLKSNGFGVGIKARLPTSVNYAWAIGGSFYPRLQHDESETGVAINSGSLSEVSRVGLDLGGEWKFDRENQLIWNLGISSERDVFDGAAGLPDPRTGTTPNNVSVTDTFYGFSLGYRWGH
ncbi:hypothetical protein [Bdellovibrio sp. HCB2-146]|uniref:hypothetical protein n=1 Tax=Bdellovibrio sp. HCB2-146 TaxID=3394362 RepID=UPI0039BC89E2